mmetsp:Transcript_27499/g.51104  ORF Transcript_27499/g.51104 Transcript_27499/m.51104 type:complete len:336 (-) Transcript_27499:884-1891(-)
MAVAACAAPGRPSAPAPPSPYNSLLCSSARFTSDLYSFPRSSAADDQSYRVAWSTISMSSAYSLGGSSSFALAVAAALAAAEAALGTFLVCFFWVFFVVVAGGIAAAVVADRAGSPAGVVEAAALFASAEFCIGLLVATAFWAFCFSLCAICLADMDLAVFMTLEKEGLEALACCRWNCGCCCCCICAATVDGTVTRCCCSTATARALACASICLCTASVCCLVACCFVACSLVAFRRWSSAFFQYASPTVGLSLVNMLSVNLAYAASPALFLSAHSLMTALALECMAESFFSRYFMRTSVRNNFSSRFASCARLVSTGCGCFCCKCRGTAAASC